METKAFLNSLDDLAITRAIAEAETRTSGEIRVFISEKEVSDPLAEGQKQFVQLGMTKTALRNGVLLYVAPKSQAFSVIGDEAVHKRCGPALWDEVTRTMTMLLKTGKHTEAIVAAITRVGTALAREFPAQPDDQNELPNRVEREKP